jgi:tyrosyl-tRNA synthetase
METDLQRAVDDQLAILRRGVEKVVPEDELRPLLLRSLSSQKPLRVKYGIDPTGIDVHLGHTVPLRKLRQFQDLGHQAVLIIGNATAMVGDPSGRDQARSKRLSAAEVESNARDYLQQVGRVIDLSRTEVYRNGDWFLQMGLGEVLRLCGQVTIAQLLTRDDFAKRYANQSPIFLHEALYPVMQAFDSVVIGADIELGGTEQLYSFMLARDLQGSAAAVELADRWMPESVRARRTAAGLLPAQVGVMSPILVGLDGVRRMGKSLGNYIGLAEPGYEMMKKFMQLPDAVLPMYFELLTSLPMTDVQQWLQGHPKQAKQTLAAHVIDQYHGAGAGREAAERWEREVSGGALPEEIPVVELAAQQLQNGALPAANLLRLAGLVPSTTEARRLIAQGAVCIGDDLTPVLTHDQSIAVVTGLLVKVGKKKVVRLQVRET